MRVGYIGYSGEKDLGGIWRVDTKGIIRNGLLAYYDVANKNSYAGSGSSLYDLSGNSNTGALTVAPTFSTNNKGYFSFNGSSQYITIPILSRSSTNITMQGWVNVGSSNVKGSMFKIGENLGYAIGIGLGDFDHVGRRIIILSPWLSWYQTATNYNTGWNMITMTLDDSSIPSIYLNNTELSETYSGWATGTPEEWANYSYIAGCIGNAPATRYFQGSVATFLFYNRKISSDEVNQNFQVTRSRFGV